MNLKELKLKLRSDFEIHIKSKIEISKCEICGETENLEVHHTTMFSEQLDYILSLLGLEGNNDLELQDNQIEVIRLSMLGSQISEKNIVLCKKCHNDIHSYGRVNISNLGYYKNQRLIKEKVKKEYVENVLIPYLEGIVGKKLFKEEQKELIDMVGLKDARGRLQKSISQLNVYLECNKFNYIILPKKSNDKRYWVVELTNNI